METPKTTPDFFWLLPLYFLYTLNFYDSDNRRLSRQYYTRNHLFLLFLSCLTRCYGITLAYTYMCKIISCTTYITRSCYRRHTKELISLHRILTIEQILILETGEFMLCYKHDLLPKTFADYFNLCSASHSHYIRAASNYRAILAHTKTRKFYVKVAGPTYGIIFQLSLLTCLSSIY